MTLLERNKAIVRRYYERLWNSWGLEAVDQIIAPDISFRGSLGVTTSGIAGFREYVNLVRAAFPDFHNHIEEMVAEGDKVVARLTYRGTHKGPHMGIAPTGKSVSYAGVAVFRSADEKIAAVWVLGDLLGLFQQLQA